MRVFHFDKCSVCHKESNPLYMCDADQFDNRYCTECFEKIGCLKDHEEGCATMVLDDRRSEKER